MTNIYLYPKDLSELEYYFFIKKFEGSGIRHLNNPNAFIESSNTMDDVYTIINETFIRCRKLNISFPFITLSYFSVPKDSRKKNYKILQAIILQILIIIFL